MRVPADLLGVRCASCSRRGAALCRECAARLVPASPDRAVPDLRRVLAAFAYEGPARRLILNLKLGGHRQCAGPLAQGVAEVVLADGLLADRITWVPGRRADIRSRGFDHAAVLARSLAALLGLPAEPLLVRVGKARDQAALNRLERISNLDRAFSSVACRGRIALVDDLLTTGATARACALALRRGGAGEVEVLVAARA